jgi:predicted  nucleic acid-binding Zn-ribbon protein
VSQIKAAQKALEGASSDDSDKEDPKANAQQRAETLKTQLQKIETEILATRQSIPRHEKSEMIRLMLIQNDQINVDLVWIL